MKESNMMSTGQKSARHARAPFVLHRLLARLLGPRGPGGTCLCMRRNKGTIPFNIHKCIL